MTRHIIAVTAMMFFLVPMQAHSNEDILRGIFGIIGNQLIQELENNTSSNRQPQQITWFDIHDALRIIGFYEGLSYDQPTKASRTAIRQFQASIDRPQTGQLTTSELQILLRSAAMKTQPNQPTLAVRPGGVSSMPPEFESNVTFVRNELDSMGFEFKPKLFKLDVPISYRARSIRYIRGLGGTVVERGDAFFSLKIEEVFIKNTGLLSVEATILAFDHNTRQRSIAFYSQMGSRCRPLSNSRRVNCGAASRQIREQILYRFE
ncbi:hypothetical protein SAMN05428979_4278 [Stappia sp. ES.058]|nr:hypothetical protein SAMN05428979_4278 [Stappia sp. ES.058]